MNNNFELIYSPTKAKTKTRKAFTPRQKKLFSYDKACSVQFGNDVDIMYCIY